MDEKWTRLVRMHIPEAATKSAKDEIGHGVPERGELTEAQECQKDLDEGQLKAGGADM